LTLPYTKLDDEAQYRRIREPGAANICIHSAIPQVFLHTCQFSWKRQVYEFGGRVGPKIEEEDLETTWDELQRGRMIQWIREQMLHCPTTRFFCNDDIPQKYLDRLPRALHAADMREISPMECFCTFAQAPDPLSPVESQLLAALPLSFSDPRKRQKLLAEPSSSALVQEDMSCL